MEDYIKQAWPFFIALVLMLAILTLVPAIALFLPETFL